MKRKEVEVEIVDRPILVPRQSGTDLEVLKAIVATVKTGKAVRVPIGGIDPKKVRERYSTRVWRLGLNLRSRRDGDAFIMWAIEPLEK